MKKLLTMSALLWISILLVWCGKQDNTETPVTNDIPNNEITENNIPSNEICTINDGILTNREEWWNITICLFDDNTFCFLEDLESWDCEKGILPLYDEEVDNNDECSNMWQDIVCWKDLNTYLNRCYLEAAWIEEETELARIENWECIFG
jgi:hypothetical protein